MPAPLYEEIYSRTLLTPIALAALPYRWMANPYRGCQHPCGYCYARGSHQAPAQPGLEQPFGVKLNAAAVLREELQRPNWTGELVALGAACDPYHPAELRYRITQQLLGVALEQRQPCWLATRSTLVLRDLARLRELSVRASVQVVFSLCTLDDDTWRHVEPDTSPPAKRLAALEHLARAGIPAGVALGPILPDLTDAPAQLEALVRAAAEHGARFLAPNLPSLRPGSKEWYLPGIRELHPHLPASYQRRYRGPYRAEGYTQDVLHVIEGLRRQYGLAEGVSTKPAAPHAGQLTLGF